MHKFNPKHLERLDNPQRRAEMPPYEILERFGLNENRTGTLLDIGCGIGYFTIPAAKILRGGYAIGIDILDEMLEHAWERADEIENIDFRKCGEYSFPVDDNSIDFAIMSNVLHEVEDKIKYLTEIRRCLKTNGELYIIEWDKKADSPGPPLEHRLSREELKEICEKAEFKVTDQMDIGNNFYGIKSIYQSN